MKFEFGDLYKFIVSLGVVLITLSLMIPWLFLKESFDLFQPEAEINSLSEVAKATVFKRQQAVSFIVEFIPWFSSIGSFTGILFTFIGLKNWYKNQVHIDEQARLDVEIKKLAIRDATKDEIEENESSEYENIRLAEGEHVDHYIVDSYRIQYSKIEELVYSKLLSIYNNKFHISKNKMVSGVELDILLRSKSLLVKDYIVEVKYIRKGFNFGWLREAYLKNIYAKSVYSQVTKRLPNTLLLIVIASNAYKEEKYKNLLSRLSDEPEARKGKDLVSIITEHELTSSNIDDLRDKLTLDA